MTEQPSSKEPSLPQLMQWLRQRHVVLVEQGAQDSYEGFIHAHIESLQRELDAMKSAYDAAYQGAQEWMKRAAPEPASALVLAKRFHEAYERLAPSFGYETRTETRVFDPESKNGRLMVAVCAEIGAAQPPAADHADHCAIFCGTVALPCNCGRAQPPGEVHPNSVNTVGIIKPPRDGQ